MEGEDRTEKEELREGFVEACADLRANEKEVNP